MGAGLSLVLCLLGGAPGRAWAQTDEERASARTLANAGAQAYDDKRWADAVDRFTRAESLVHAPPHWLWIARAQVQLGRLVSAREAYLKVIRENLAPTAPRAFRDAQAAARKELPELEPRIPMIKIHVSGGEATAVSVDGKPLPTALIGVSYPIDPGPHELSARGAGKASTVQRVNVAEGAREAVTLTLVPVVATPPLAADRAQDRSGAAEASPQVDLPPPGPAESRGDAATGPSRLRLASYAAAGVGVVGLAAGSFFGLRSISKRSDADDICPDADRCPVTERERVNELDDSAGQAKTLATVGFIVGGVGIASGVTLFLLSNKPREEKASRGARAVTIEPWIAPLGTGVRGTF